MIRRCDDRDFATRLFYSLNHFAQAAHGWGVKKQQVPPLRYAAVGMTNGFRSKILLHSQYRGHCRSLGWLGMTKYRAGTHHAFAKRGVQSFSLAGCLGVMGLA
jgi:hypothetical protein